MNDLTQHTNPAPRMKRIVRVTIEKEIEVEITPAMFGPLMVEQYLAEFSKTFFAVHCVDDLIDYAARMAAHHGPGNHEGLGLLGYAHSTYPRVPDVKFTEIYDETETEFVD